MAFIILYTKAVSFTSSGKFCISFFKDKRNFKNLPKSFRKVISRAVFIRLFAFVGTLN